MHLRGHMDAGCNCFRKDDFYGKNKKAIIPDPTIKRDYGSQFGGVYAAGYAGAAGSRRNGNDVRTLDL